ncbi:hypothetical protein [Geomicrobium sp. JCM 19055]|nr:hypothetical protein [Geomicrobium sp. JCM 19055]
MLIIFPTVATKVVVTGCKLKRTMPVGIAIMTSINGIRLAMKMKK